MKGIVDNYSYGGLQRVQHRGSTTIGKTKMMHPSYEAWKDACDTMMRKAPPHILFPVVSVLRPL